MKKPAERMDNGRSHFSLLGSAFLLCFSVLRGSLRGTYQAMYFLKSESSGLIGLVDEIRKANEKKRTTEEEGPN
jgi:hypothetical protein